MDLLFKTKQAKRSFMLREAQSGKGRKITELMAVQSTTPSGAARKIITRLCGAKATEKRRCSEKTPIKMSLVEVDTTSGGRPRIFKGGMIPKVLKSGEVKSYKYKGEYKKNKRSVNIGGKKIMFGYMPIVKAVKK